jgi:hypothetical protein
MTNPSFDNGIPELTEVLPPEVVAEAVAAPVITPRISHPASVGNTHAAVSSIAPTFGNDLKKTDVGVDWPDEKWRSLETDIRNRISEQVLRRVESVLEQRVRDGLADVLQIAVEGLAAEIRQGLSATLEDVIARAVAQEIANFKSSKN